MKTIAIASDHAGFETKRSLIIFLRNLGAKVTDFGTYSEQSCDYPDFAVKCANAVRDKQSDLGILICGTGIGVSIAANKVKGIRCALCHDEYTARMSREHNDANILAVGARTTTYKAIEKIVSTFISTPFSQEEKHLRRIDKIADYENSK